MNRLLPLILVAAAVGLHLGFCEWDVRKSPRGVSQAQHERTIYFRYSASRSVYLLAKTAEGKQDATLFGVLLPGMLVGGAALIGHVQRSESAVG